MPPSNAQPSKKIAVDQTCWAFVSGSAEDRHLFDIIFAVDVLRQRGVPEKNLLVFCDHPQAALQLGPYGITSVFGIQQLEQVVATRGDVKAVVAVVTGHGEPAGIPVSGGSPMKPTALRRAIRACATIEAGIVVLGQCYAGIFHYLDVDEAPPLCFMGAVHLNPSLSRITNLGAPILRADKTPGLQQWLANVFLTGFFDWFKKPVDVDGDGRLTLMDAYKHAGMFVYQQSLAARPRDYVEAEKHRRGLVASLEELQADPAPTPMKRLQVLTHLQRLSEVLEALHMHQEPWVLNARLATSLEL